jgi:transposase
LCFSVLSPDPACTQAYAFRKQSDKKKKAADAQRLKQGGLKPWRPLVWYEEKAREIKQSLHRTREQHERDIRRDAFFFNLLDGSDEPFGKP